MSTELTFFGRTFFQRGHFSKKYCESQVFWKNALFERKSSQKKLILYSFGKLQGDFNQFQGENGGEKMMGGKRQGVW